MNNANVDALLHYILAKAGEADDYMDRSLGPIHLIKYVYLADLAYAEEHEGQTFTDLDWKFYRFGPWSFALYERIPVALTTAGAICTSFPSAYIDDDFQRWTLRDSKSAQTAGRHIGIHLTGLIASLVKRFSNLTPELLDFVYKTPPMLRAAPLEDLDFTPSNWRYQDSTPFISRNVSAPLTKRQEKRLEAWADKVQRGVRERLDALKAARNKEKFDLDTAIYDDVFYEGMAALNSADGIEIQQGKFTAEFHSDIWKSKVRHDPDLSD